MNRLPTLFVSHGAPTFALAPGRAGPALTALGRALPRPRALLLLSPHWMTRGMAVGASAAPETVHDFGGFPAALYTLRYPAPGAPQVAARVVELLATEGHAVRADAGHGLDHGAWVPLLHLYPEADVPALQLSLPLHFDAADAWRLGRSLAPLSDEGVLIVGSGSLTHNLADFRFDFQGAPAAGDADYVRRFVDWSRQAVGSGDSDAIVDYLHSAPDALRAHPTPDHYLPLPFAAGAAGPGVRGSLVDGGIVHGVLSMDAFVFGMEPQ